VLLMLGWPATGVAGETACWLDGQVLVAPAEVAGIAGDYVIDTGAAQTLLADTQAQAAGFGETALTGTVRLAGMTRAGRRVAVTPLDARFRRLPTPVAGVIGADVLAAYVVDVSFAPCRIALHRPGAAPRFGRGSALRLSWRGGRPAAWAAVSDGGRTLAGAFVLATGSDTTVRLADDRADVPGAPRREDLYPYGPARPRLRALSFGGELFETLPSGLLPAAQGAEAGPAPVLGEIGLPALRRFRLRFDFPAGRLDLAKAKGPPERSGGP
jgi:hypothetical protein